MSVESNFTPAPAPGRNLTFADVIATPATYALAGSTEPRLYVIGGHAFDQETDGHLEEDVFPAGQRFDRLGGDNEIVIRS